MELAQYRGESCAPTSCRQLSIRERLESNKADLESNLKRVTDALEALDANPETAKVLELISKV